MKEIGTELFNKLSGMAEVSVRKRSHNNLHQTLDDPIHRLCVGIEPGSYIRPHRHTEAWKWELFVILQGAASIMSFDDKGILMSRIDISPNGAVRAVEIPPGTWHTLLSREKGTVLFEIKAGPYAPLPEYNFASWAPEEGSDKALSFETQLHTLEVGKSAADLIL
ncbi:WbuC family cupin fold metalloprotein [bacterium]|nr:WbuC family cupin fold metalloprotein [bacterium]